MAKWILVQAAMANSGIVVIGDESVIAAAATVNSVQLRPGNKFIIHQGTKSHNLLDFYADSTVSGDILTVTYEPVD